MTKKKSGRRIAAALGVATLALLTACQSGGDTDGSAAGPVELRMTLWSSNDLHLELFNEIADSYVETNPDLVSAVTFESIPSSEYQSTVTTQIAGGDAPDVIWVSESYAQEFVARGVLHDIAPSLQATEGYEYDDLLPSALEQWSDGDALYAYPFSNSPLGMYVNLDLIEAAGQPNPRDLIAAGEWTWDAAAEIAGTTAESQGVVGFLPPEDPYTNWRPALSAMWMSWGASAWSEDGTECGFDSPEMVDFFTWLHAQVFDTGAVLAPGTSADFAAGEAALRLAQLSASAALSDDFAWDFVPMPAGPAGNVAVVGQGAMGVTALSDHPQQAADFLAYLTNPENSLVLAQFFPPPRQSLLTVETLAEAAPALTEDQLQTTVIDQALVGTTISGHVRLSGMTDTIRAGLDALWVADADIEDTLAAVCESIAPQLEQS